MRFATIKFYDGVTASYNMEMLRITKGFVKIEDSLYGNVAIPMDNIESILVEIEEQHEEDFI